MELEIGSLGINFGNEHMISILLEICLFHLYECCLNSRASSGATRDAAEGEQLYDLLFVTIAFLAFAAIEEYDGADADY